MPASAPPAGAAAGDKRAAHAPRERRDRTRNVVTVTTDKPIAKAHLYTDLASWWPLFSDPDDYAEEAAWIERKFCEALGSRPRELLELGSGGGNVASHLHPDIALTLVEPAPGMVEVSRARNPHARHVLGDMRDVRLDKTFDAVLIHDAVMYMTTPADLGAALLTARSHLRDEGALMVLPDHLAETFSPESGIGGHDAKDGSGRGLRYVSWSHEPARGATTFDVDYAILLRHEDGTVEARHDRHTEGLFSRQTWRDAFVRAGFAPPQEFVDPWRREVFVARPAP